MALLLLFVVAICANAQLPTASENALRETVRRFYQSQVDKNWSAAAEFVAADTKNDFNNIRSGYLLNFHIGHIDTPGTDGHARVMIDATLQSSSDKRVFDVPIVTTWKIEDQNWRWYISPEERLAAPYGTAVALTGDADTLLNQVLFEPAEIELSPYKRDQIVTITNMLPTQIDLELPALSVRTDTRHLNAGEKAYIEFHLDDYHKLPPIVPIVVFPLNRSLNVHVKIK
jgi:hypothetical protein